jgi:S-phase kinase-associated protein 1
MATLVSNDGAKVRATSLAVKQSITFGTMLEILDEEMTRDMPIPVPEVDGETLSKVVEWCEQHRDDKVPELGYERVERPNHATTAAVPGWDAQFLEPLDRDLLFKITNAANYLEIQLLLKYGVQVIAKRIKGMSIPEMREFLNIENDLTPEQEAEIREQNKWAVKS